MTKTVRKTLSEVRSRLVPWCRRIQSDNGVLILSKYGHDVLQIKPAKAFDAKAPVVSLTFFRDRTSAVIDLLRQHKTVNLSLHNKLIAVCEKVESC